MNKNAASFINKLKKDKKLIFIVVLGLSGMIMLLLSAGLPSENKTVKNDNADLISEEERIEKQLTSILKCVEGAGDVKVMVTLEASGEQVVAQDTEIMNEDNATEEKKEYVIVENSGDSQGLILKTITPVVRGVAICCEGADSSVVRQEITKLVSAGLGIPANKVWVAAMQK